MTENAIRVEPSPTKEKSFQLIRELTAIGVFNVNCFEPLITDLGEVRVIPEGIIENTYGEVRIGEFVDGTAILGNGFSVCTGEVFQVGAPTNELSLGVVVEILKVLKWSLGGVELPDIPDVSSTPREWPAKHVVVSKIRACWKFYDLSHSLIGLALRLKEIRDTRPEYKDPKKFDISKGGDDPFLKGHSIEFYHDRSTLSIVKPVGRLVICEVLYGGTYQLFGSNQDECMEYAKKVYQGFIDCFKGEFG